MDETERRRIVQEAYNKEKGIVPQTILKPVRNLLHSTAAVAEGKASYGKDRTTWSKLTKSDGQAMIAQFEKEMQDASRRLEFERAAELRDVIFELQERFGRPSKKAKSKK